MQEIESVIDRKIAHFMVDKKITQKQMAWLLDMQETTLSQKRRGLSEWKLSEAIRLADILELESLNDLVS